MSLKTDANMRKLAELLAVFGGKGPQYWRDHAEEAVRLLVVFDFMVEAAEEDSRPQISRPALKAVRA